MIKFVMNVKQEWHKSFYMQWVNFMFQVLWQ